MALRYGYVKAKIISRPVLKGSRRRSEVQYHLHFSLMVDGAVLSQIFLMDERSPRGQIILFCQ